MSYLTALLVAEAHRAGRAQRSATRCHRRLAKKPFGLLLWQLGAEPFTAAAVAWGFGPKRFDLAVPGEPRDRELAFRALTKVAKAFNPWLEGGHGGDGPQVIVPNRGNLAALARLARRLAYLPTDGDKPADEDLVRFGWHLRFLTDRARAPGQQLILCATDLIATHWVTELSEVEMQNLPAADAAVDPPEGLTAHEAVLAAERLEIGPAPSSAIDDETDRLLTTFNEARQRATDEAIVAPLRGPLEEHYRRLVALGWPLLWRCIDRERRWPEAAGCERRWAPDVEALDRHLEWVVANNRRYRTRQTYAQSARTLHDWEEAQRELTADEALDDPLRMAPYFLTHEAISGRVVQVDLDHYLAGAKRRTRRPQITILTDEPAEIPKGRKLYWSKVPKVAYVVLDVAPADRGRRSRIVLEYQSSVLEHLVAEKADVVLSVHCRSDSRWLVLPRKRPWTHTVGAPVRDIESGEASWE